MAGGQWTTQNKTRPGVYINFTGEGGTAGTASGRGTMALALSLPWGPSKQLLAIQAGDDISALLGYDLAAPQLLLAKEALKRSNTLLLYRLNAGVKASVTSGGLTATAKHGGSRGNDLTIVIQENIDDENVFDVKTLLSGNEVDRQTVASITELAANDWIVFSGTGALTATAGAPLTGGADGTVTNQDHSDFLAAAELFEFQTIALPSTDATLKSIYTAYIRRLREEEGKKVQAVLENYSAADSEGVISVKNGVVLADGTTLTAAQATAWVAAATASAQMNESLTYKAYDDAIDATPRYTNSQIEAAIVSGELVFVPNNGRAIVEQDINTFRSFSPNKDMKFSKNRVIRVLDGIGNDVKRIFESFYVGKVDNNPDGRGLLRSEIVSYLNTLQQIGAIQNFNSQTDIAVLEGQDADSVYVEVHAQPVDSIEKIYMKVKVK
ncbi:hypothetical protein PAESOLCIP111_01965 [Paenibacillus solanacearum]|uniref:Phage tail sheath protein n=1 Tax=Paenibacillus solanacearum TaxID=2048548 RepID=A0A916K0A5_9BACL|nr:phage tail sheath family protein [Paenibacillus solanacearum]CAG7616970.1 hypothetical protein PAESOLCIP111_01965 [Paenibacillus solanacearum]